MLAAAANRAHYRKNILKFWGSRAWRIDPCRDNTGQNCRSSAIGLLTTTTSASALDSTASDKSVHRPTLRHCLNIGVRVLNCSYDNPMRKVRPVTEPRGRVRFLDCLRERDCLLRECRAHSDALYLIVVIALSTGARTRRFSGLRWPDVDMQRGTLVFHQYEKWRTPICAAGWATPPSKCARIQRYGRLDTDLVFPGVAGDVRSLLARCFARRLASRRNRRFSFPRFAAYGCFRRWR